MKTIDLTTESGIEKARTFLSTAALLNPGFALVKWALDKLFTTPEEQGKTVERLIEAGKKQGVDEMKIVMKDKGGLTIKVPNEGCEIDVHAGKNQTTVVHVKYK